MTIIIISAIAMIAFLAWIDFETWLDSGPSDPVKRSRWLARRYLEEQNLWHNFGSDWVEKNMDGMAEVFLKEIREGAK